MGFEELRLWVKKKKNFVNAKLLGAREYLNWNKRKDSNILNILLGITMKKKKTLSENLKQKSYPSTIIVKRYMYLTTEYELLINYLLLPPSAIFF